MVLPLPLERGEKGCVLLDVGGLQGATEANVGYANAAHCRGRQGDVPSPQSRGGCPPPSRGKRAAATRSWTNVVQDPA